jgi:hypothetical protein
MVECSEPKLKEVLKTYRPSQLDEQLLTACPFYEQDSKELTSAYRLIHEIAKSRILVKLQMRLNEVSIVSELPLEFGRVDGAAGNRIALKNNNDDIILFIEIKTGSIKFVQPAIYTLQTKKKTLVAELKTGDVFVVDIELAEVIVEELITHLKEKDILRQLNKKIPGSECRYCGAECEFRRKVKANGSPLKSLPNILNNIDVIVDKIAAEISKELNTRFCQAAEAA